MAYKKPQDPLTNNGFGIYPLTTADQVILSDGSRLEKNGQISIGGGTVKTVSGVAPDSAGNVALTASDVGAASAESVNQLKDDKLDKTGTAADSSKLGGKTLAEIMLTLYPVGAVYISVNSTSPASLFGGTWEQLQDRFLLAAGGTYSAGSTGGEATHTLTVDEIPSHTHTINRYTSSVGSKGTGFSREKNVAISKDNQYGPYSTGGDLPHNNMPPYLAVYMWKRVS